MSKALVKKAINAYSGSGSNSTFDTSKYAPKNSVPNKYGTMSNPKGRTDQHANFADSKWKDEYLNLARKKRGNKK